MRIEYNPQKFLLLIPMERLREYFDRRHLLVDAVTRALEIISEASRRLPDELKTRHPEIDAVDAAASLTTLSERGRRVPELEHPI